jgi:hypothetical protein
MASRSHTWFDAEKLLPGEELVRTGSARVRTDAPPYWWEGELILTTDRLFFLPHVENPFLQRVAFWLRELIDIGPAGRNRLHVRTTNEAALFQAIDLGPHAVAGRASGLWLSLIRKHLLSARPAEAFKEDPQRRRAAG